MKKGKRRFTPVLAAVLAAALILTILPLTAIPAYAAESGECGAGVIWELDDNGKLTISYTDDVGGWMKDYMGSEQPPWYGKRILEVEIGEGVTTIGVNAFSGCTSLQSVTIPKSVEQIGNAAFYECASLENVTILEGVTKIGDSAFADCSSLENMTIPQSVTEIDAHAFEDCSALKNVTIPAGLTEIRRHTFYGCSSLTNVTIPVGVKEIGTSAFGGCSSLENVTIPVGVKEIGDNAFVSCMSLGTVELPSTLESIGETAFGNVTNDVQFYYNDTWEAWNQVVRGFEWTDATYPSLHCVYTAKVTPDSTAGTAEGTMTIHNIDKDPGKTDLYVEAKPVGDYIFTGWTADGQEVYGNPYSQTFDDLSDIPTTLTANFKLREYQEEFHLFYPDPPLEKTIEGFTTDISGVLLDAGFRATGKVTVNGLLEAANTGATANASQGEEGSPSQATIILGDVTAGKTGVEANANGDNTLAYVTGDNITSTGYGFRAVWVDADNSGEAQIEADDVTSSAGVHVLASNNGAAGLIAANIISTLEVDEDNEVNEFLSSDKGDVKAQIESITSNVNGINASAASQGWTQVNVIGEVKAAGNGLNLFNNSGVVYTDAGSVSAGKDAIHYSSGYTGTDSESVIMVESSATSTGGNAIWYDSGNGSTALLISGNAASNATDATTAGISYCGTDDGTDNVLVVGTLSGCNGVILSDQARNRPGKLDLTTWKIKANGGEIIKGDDEKGTFAKSVNYIVNIIQPEEYGTIYATKADGSPLDRKYNDAGVILGEEEIDYPAGVGEEGFAVTHEGDKILLKGDFDLGYGIVAAYNIDSEGEGAIVPLEKDENGDYYLIVPRGGGISLSADIDWAPYTISTKAEHGKINVAKSAYYNDTVAVEATPDKGYVLSKLTFAPKGGKETDITAARSFVMPGSDVTVKAVFTPSVIPFSDNAFLAKMTAKGKNALQLSWSKVNGAQGYDIFLAGCKKDAKYQLARTIVGNKTHQWTKKGLDEKRVYKAKIKAWVKKNGKKTYIKTSPRVHACTSNSTKKYTNAASVTVDKPSLTLDAGASYTIKAKVNKVDKNKKLIAHEAELRYVSGNTKVATVSKTGTITAKAAGSCNVYVYAVNGMQQAIRVTVK